MISACHLDNLIYHTWNRRVVYLATTGRYIENPVDTQIKRDLLEDAQSQCVSNAANGC